MPLNEPGRWNFFISHVQNECGAEALAIATQLGPADCWLDVNMADKSEKAMREGVENSEYFVLILSDDYLKRAFTLKEIRWCLELGKPIISAYKRGTAVGSVLGTSPPDLRCLAAVDSVEVNRSNKEFFKVTVVGGRWCKLDPGLKAPPGFQTLVVKRMTVL